MVRPVKPKEPPKPRKSKAGRKPFVPTAEQRRMVECMAGVGVTQADISSVLRMSTATLNKAFRAELDRAAGVVQHKAISVLFDNLNSKDPWVRHGSATFLLRTRFRWTERIGVDVDGQVKLTADKRVQMHQAIWDAACRVQAQAALLLPSPAPARGRTIDVAPETETDEG